MKINRFLIVSLLGALVFMVFLPYLVHKLNQNFGLPVYTSIVGQIAGLAIIVLGIVNYIYCSIIFIQNGKGGTPLITEPPKQLILKGVYKYTRNPIYIGHLAIVFGEFLVLGSSLLLVYLVLLFLLLHLLLVLYEEPQLRSRYGEIYRNYCKRVPRWF